LKLNYECKYSKDFIQLVVQPVVQRVVSCIRSFTLYSVYNNVDLKQC